MRRPFLILPLFFCCAAAFASEPARVDGPVLGLVLDRTVGGVRPILGIAGASIFGEPVALGIDTSRAAASSASGYVLGAALDTGRVMLFRDPRSGIPGAPVENAAPTPDRIILSASGASAALLYGDRNAIQVFAGLPSSPQLRGEISLFGTPGPLSAIAVSDDGESVLAGARNADGGESVMLLSAGAGPRVLGSAGSVAAAAFFAGNRDAAFADGSARAVYRIRDVRDAAEFVPLPGSGISKITALQISLDGRKVLVAGETAIATLDLDSGAAAVSRCDCAISTLDRLRGDAAFRVTGLSDAPSWLFDAGGPGARFLFIPAAQASSRVIRGDRLLPAPTAPLPLGGAR